MPEITANAITLHYDTHGDPSDPPMLLVMGLGAQMTLWPPELVDALAGRGFHVIRFDNRDIGLSQKMDGAGQPSIALTAILAKLGFRRRLPYQLSDMADDAAGLLDALEIETAHVVGASMGGMIAQHMAIAHSDRLRSLTSIMSTTGNPKLPAADKTALDALTKRPAGTDRATLLEHGEHIARSIGSPAHPAEADRLRARIEADLDRSFHPDGLPRQFAAIIADGDRRARLRQVRVPTLVLHGEDDPLVRVEAGRDTAAAIPGAELKTIPGWGHDLPLALIDELADAIAAHARRADRVVT